MVQSFQLRANYCKHLTGGKETFFKPFYTKINGENALENNTKSNDAFQNNHDPRPGYMANAFTAH